VIAFAKDARSLQARPLEEAGIAFCARHGFRETMRMHHLELVLADARLDPYRSTFDRIAGDGIAIVTLADFAARAHDGEAAFLDLFDATRAGWPDPDPDLPGEPPTEVVWIPHVRRHLATDPTPIVAEQSGRLVGFTSILGTGVRPELRNRGIATALKVAAIDAAIARGETVMRSSTGNPPMIHINAKLGFREVLVEQRMVRLL
jgi:GNAT superfamily N-acetyltransferase